MNRPHVDAARPARRGIAGNACINWLRTAPYVRAWARAYRDDGQDDPVGERTLEITFLEPGAQAYAFTFG